MAQSKEEKKRFIPDLLAANTIIEVIKTDKDGNAQKKEMTYGEWKTMKKQKGFTYRAYQLKYSQYNLNQ